MEIITQLLEWMLYGGGLFGYISGGTLKNLFITNSTAYSAGSDVQYAGLAVGVILEYGNCERVSVQGSVYTTRGGTKANVIGGLIGLVEGNVNECSAVCENISVGSNAINGVYSSGGGLVRHFKIFNCK